MGGGLVAGDPVAPPEGSSVGQSQEDAWVDQGGEGGVQVLLQALLQPALLRKLFLKKKKKKYYIILLLLATCYMVSMLTR